MKTATYTIRGTTPMLMHSERLANPFDPLTKEIKAISGKRKKTEDDLLEMARLSGWAASTLTTTAACMCRATTFLPR